MNGSIDQLYASLRVRLANRDSRFFGLKVKLCGKADHSVQDIGKHLEQARKRLDQDRAKVSAAEAEIRDWAKSREIATANKIAEWKSQHEATKLQSRAEKACRYAAAQPGSFFPVTAHFD